MTARIRWEPDGNGDLAGRVGTFEPLAFFLGTPLAFGEDWYLSSYLPGQEHHRDCGDPDVLKAEAERWLAEFVASLGAVFPPGPVVSRCECGGLASHQHGCRWRQGYGSLIEAVTDATPVPSAPGGTGEPNNDRTET